LRSVGHGVILIEIVMMIRAIPGLALLLLLQPAPFDGARDALSLGRTRDEALFAAFNRGYSLSAADTVDSAEIITEFRRAVLIVREHASQGEYGFTERDLSIAIAPYRGLITFVVQARLHPLNTFTKPPPYDIYISTGPDSPPVASKSLKRDPVYPVGAGPMSSIVGVRIEATFPREAIASASAPSLVLIDDRAEILWQSRIDLSRYR
jgi:hypothetical protein